MRDLSLDVAHYHADGVALLEDVDAEAAQVGFGNGQVHFRLLFELPDLFLAHDAIGNLLYPLRGEGGLFNHLELAMELGAGRGPGAEVEVRGVFHHHDLEVVFEFHALPSPEAMVFSDSIPSFFGVFPALLERPSRSSKGCAGRQDAVSC